MALINNGFWSGTYWASRYWQEDYWPEYGAVAVAPPAVGGVSYWLRPRSFKIKENKGLLTKIVEWLEAKLRD